MTEHQAKLAPGLAPGRDWLAELRAAKEAGDTEGIKTLVPSIAATAPELRGPVCDLLGEIGEGWREWGEPFFIFPETQPSVGPAGDFTSALGAAIAETKPETKVWVYKAEPAKPEPVKRRVVGEEE